MSTPISIIEQAISSSGNEIVTVSVAEVAESVVNALTDERIVNNAVDSLREMIRSYYEGESPDLDLSPVVRDGYLTTTDLTAMARTVLASVGGAS